MISKLDQDFLIDSLPEKDEDDEYSHYAKREDIMMAMVEGTPITALCGKTWIPSKNPEGRPLCGTCKRLMEHLRSF